MFKTPVLPFAATTLACLLVLYVPYVHASTIPPALETPQAESSFKALRVNGARISVREFEATLQQMLARGVPDSPTLRATVRAQVLTQEVLRQAARKQQLQKDPQVIAVRKQAADLAEDQAMVQRYLALNLKPTRITEADIAARYQTIVATLGEQEYKPAIIAVASEAEAKGLIDRIKKSEAGFAELAVQHSLLPSAAQGGEMDWVSFKVPATEGKTGYLPQPIAAVVAALPAGSTSESPVLVDGRYFIVHVVQVRATQIPALNSIAPALRRALEMQALEHASTALITQLLGAARIE